MKDKQSNYQQEGITGTVYGVTVLPSTFEEWADECAKRKVSKEENLDVMLYLPNQAIAEELENVPTASPQQTEDYISKRLTELENKLKGQDHD